MSWSNTDSSEESSDDEDILVRQKNRQQKQPAAAATKKVAVTATKSKDRTKPPAKMNATKKRDCFYCLDIFISRSVSVRFPLRRSKNILS